LIFGLPAVAATEEEKEGRQNTIEEREKNRRRENRTEQNRTVAQKRSEALNLSLLRSSSFENCRFLVLLGFLFVCLLVVVFGFLVVAFVG
jgi:hypothetical protein